MTAAELLDALTRAGRRPAVEGPEVVFTAPPPPALIGPLTVLLTGVRALLLGRRWYGIDRPGARHRQDADGPRDSPLGRHHW